MGVETRQVCDRCLTERTVKDSSVPALQKDGWRRVALDVAFGEMRSEQPTLCPDCQRVLKAEIEDTATKVRAVREKASAAARLT